LGKNESKIKSEPMSEKTFFKTRLYFTGIVALAIWSLLAWNYYHGGVPSHHLLAREDLPSFSNWWGGLLLPLLAWFLSGHIQKRIYTGKEKDSKENLPAHVVYGFLGALLFGIVLSIFFTFRNEEVPFYMMMGLLALALFFPIYRAECFLGFVIGMTFTFGGVLPIIIGSVLTLLGTVLYLLVRPAILFVSRGLVNLATTKK
jgi:hypothetical protein